MKSTFLFIAITTLLNANSVFASGSLWSCVGEKVQLSGVSGYKSLNLHNGELTVEGKSYNLRWEQRNRESHFQELHVEELNILIIPITFFKNHQATAKLIVLREGETFPIEVVECKVAG